MASIRRRKGKWQAQVRRQGHRQLARSFIHRRDAEAWARQAEAELDRAALPVDPRKLKALTFGELLERYAAEVTPRKRGAYAEMSRVRLLRGAAIYRVGLAQLTANHIEDYLRGRQSTVCGETARKDGILIRQVIASASWLWGIKLGSNPALQVKLPPPSNPRTRRLSPSDHEKLRQALARTRSPFVAAAIDLALHTGMRRGELLAARWSDLDLEQRTLRLAMTKNGHPRTIPLAPEAMETIKGLRAMAVGERILPISANALRLAWERLKRRAGIEDLRFHDLRHEAISRLFEKGLNVPEVAVMSGHRDPRMLFRYTHPRPEDIARKLAKSSG
jgi:integrase